MSSRHQPSVLGQVVKGVYQKNPATKKMYLEVYKQKFNSFQPPENVASRVLVPVYGALPYNRNAPLSTKIIIMERKQRVVVMERRIFFQLIMGHSPPYCWGLQHFRRPTLEVY